NSIIWPGSIEEAVPVWFAITTKFDVGATAALPACCLSLALQLWRVSGHRVQQKHVLALDLALCWGYPAIRYYVNYVYQGHRFDIIEDSGCHPTSYLSVPAILLFYAPVVVVVFLAFIFSVLAFAALYKQRCTFASFSQTNKSSFTTRRYVRLMVITAILAVWEAAVIGVIFGFTFRSPVFPYNSWADVHYGFSHAAKYPAALVPSDVLFWTYVGWWTIPISGYSFFCSLRSARRPWRSTARGCAGWRLRSCA
ncbi:GPCR fungal pheromone mating factor, partial [Mycena rosella]